VCRPVRKRLSRRPGTGQSIRRLGAGRQRIAWSGCAGDHPGGSDPIRSQAAAGHRADARTFRSRGLGGAPRDRVARPDLCARARAALSDGALALSAARSDRWRRLCDDVPNVSYRGINLGALVRRFEDSASPLPGGGPSTPPAIPQVHLSLFRESDGTLLAGDALATMNQESWLSTVMREPELRWPPAALTTDWTAANCQRPSARGASSARDRGRPRAAH